MFILCFVLVVYFLSFYYFQNNLSLIQLECTIFSNNSNVYKEY